MSPLDLVFTLSSHVTRSAGIEFYSGCSSAEYELRDANCTITSGQDVIKDYNMDFVTRTEAVFIALGLFALTWLGAVYGVHKAIRSRQA